MTLQITPHTIGFITKAPDLSSVDLTYIAPAQFNLVRTLRQGLWHYRSDSTDVADGVTIVAALGQPGNFIRDPSGTPGAHLTTAWYVDTSAGDDTAAGNTALLPLKSTAEIFRRIGQQPITSQTVAINGSGPVTVLSQAPASATNGSAIAASLASTATAMGASLVGIEDAGGRITATQTEAALAELAGRLAQAPADITALKAIGATARVNGMMAVLLSDGSKWRFVSASSLTGDDLLVVTPAAGTGRWFRMDTTVDVIAAITFNSADAAVLWTVPTGWRVVVGIPYWEVTTSWTGGSSSAIGLSSSNGGLSTKGDLLGGSSGDVQATLVSTGAFAKGTIGALAGKPGAVLVGGQTVRFDRITSVFTAGAGNAHIPVHVVLVPAS